MTTLTAVNSAQTLRRWPTGTWQTTGGSGFKVSPPVLIYSANLVHAPFVGVRKSSVSTISDKLVRPLDYRGKA